ncbi:MULTISPECIES: chorismate synthase [Trueperella]|uniref:Chorismate synthase n=1 Tax=Trueperella abortisuis TaxID=445930 RepID=A0ABT9PI16_9ACTO|nr:MULTISPECIES: chorismate synthase [Trueperella]MCI7305029.1 chorismate synthase [Trueperella sp.]MDP9832362.1 chorismate synthase [Trueperella abortisuis]
MIRWSTAGESHGPALVALFEGMPAGVRVTSEDIKHALWRRRLGYGRGSRQQFEQDELRILSGIRHGQTLGSPIALEIGNSEWPKWSTVMSADPVAPEALLIDAGTGDEREVSRNKPLTRPRPGHADLVGMNKYGFNSARPVLERASARETAARVALGELAKQLLAQAAGTRIVSHVVEVGAVRGEGLSLPTPEDAPALDGCDVRQLNTELAAAFRAEVDAAKKDADTLGGVVEVAAWGVPQGLGTHVRGQDRLDGRLAGALMSIQAVKGVEIGDGFDTARRRGSEAHDEIVREGGSLHRLTNRAGGIEGGMSNGEPIVVRVAYKPISTVPRALRTIDVATGEAATALHQRSDTTAVVPGAVIAEAMVALVLAEALVEKFGGDSLAEIRRNLDSWWHSIDEVRR